MMKSRFNNLLHMRKLTNFVRSTILYFSVGKKVHWEFLTDSPQELTLQDNEVVISCGIRFSPSGAKLSETIKVTLDHNAHFTNPRRAEIVFYTRNKGLGQLPRGPDKSPCDNNCSGLYFVKVICRWIG